jgi:ubiquitin-protein ligase
MSGSPRDKRLHSDFRALQQLRADSTILEFECRGEPPDRYRIAFVGKGLWRLNNGHTAIRDRHEVLITLNSAYPRMMPELAWQTPIFHPNISASGIVCLGGYGTHWAPSLKLDELCHMLWDMIRYQNYDIESPYNRDAAMWARGQNEFAFPVDPRPLRNRIAGELFVTSGAKPPLASNAAFHSRDVQFVEVVDAEIVQSRSVNNDDIVFID